MTQILVTLENGADSNLIQRIIENIKGVFHTTVETHSSANNISKEHIEWMEKIKNLTESFDSSLIDMEDERTRYLMNK